MHTWNWTRIRLAVAPLALCGALLAASPAARAQSTQPNPEVRVTTSLGSFVIELRPDRAPLTVANFLHYVNAGFYTNTLFHRVITNFIIQGGGHAATAPYALKPTYPPVVNESGNGLENKRGAVGLARATDPDTGNSQFYVNVVDNPELDPLPTRWGYAVFGQVVQGMDVVDRIADVPTGAFGPFHADAPLTPVVIENIQVIGTSGGGTAQPSSVPPAQPTGTGAPGSAPAPAGSPAPKTHTPATPAHPPGEGTGEPKPGS